MHKLWVVIIMLGICAGPLFAEDSVNQPMADVVAQAIEDGDNAAALTAAQTLDASAVKDLLWAKNAYQVASLLWATGQRDAAVSWLEQEAAAVNMTDTATTVDKARVSALSSAARILVRKASDPTRMVSIARLSLTFNNSDAYAFQRLFAGLVSLEDNDTALQVCLDYAGKVYSMQIMRARRLDLLTRVGTAEQCKAEAVEILKVTDDISQALSVLKYALPANDVSLCSGMTAQQVVNGVKVMLRKENGQLNTETLVALAEQLTNGGDATPLIVSDDAGTVAGQLTDAPLAGYLVPLLTGDYAAAIKAGYDNAKATDTDKVYLAWINATAGAIRCMEQNYNGKAIDFIKFVNGETTTNPVATEVGE